MEDKTLNPGVHISRQIHMLWNELLVLVSFIQSSYLAADNILRCLKIDAQPQIQNWITISTRSYTILLLLFLLYFFFSFLFHSGLVLKHLSLFKPKTVFDKFDYIMIDEIHEQNADTSSLLGMIKLLHLRGHLKIKVILMSAEVNTEMFSGYFF